MRGLLVSLLVSVAIFQVSSGRVYDAKQDAIKQIDAKYKEAVTMKASVLTAVSNERKNLGGTGEKDLDSHLAMKCNETVKEIEAEASAVIRTAIVQGKPIAVINCIKRVSFSGTNLIQNSSVSFKKAIRDVKVTKIMKIDFDEYAANAIVKGLGELVEQAKAKLNDPSAIIDNIKREAISNCNSAMLLLGEIECCVHEPVLSREYVKLRQTMDRELANLKAEVVQQLQKCLSDGK